jgi:1-acyl-sn-glycerol-3-phosphate acyltransferase
MAATGFRVAPRLDLAHGTYTTGPQAGRWLSRLWPSLAFYSRTLPIVFRASAKAKRGIYDDAAWSASSLEIVRALERVGARLDITGLEHVAALDGPCVLIGNHMSTLETFVLPVLLVPFRRITFVVKQSLIEYPVFGHVMRSRDPIVVGRTNPREDLKAVLDGGTERLAQGISIVIFPQTTRTVTFDPKAFNTIGVKLAKKASVPVIPFALKTDAWGNGRLHKDFGRIDPSRTVHFAFGAPLRVADRGGETHEAIIHFISTHLTKWGGSVEEWLRGGLSSAHGAEGKVGDTAG